MNFKRSFSSLCIGVALAVSLPGSSAFAVHPHIILDFPQNSQVFADLFQMIMAYYEAKELVKEMQDMNSTIGELKKAPGKMFENLKDGLKDETDQFIKATISEKAKELGLDKAQEKAKEVQQIVKKDILPLANMDSKEARDRAVIRVKIREDAVADAYATALAYMSASTKSETEKVEPAKNTVSDRETLKDKQDGANEVAVARLKEQIDGNRLLASYLLLQAANSMGDLSVYTITD